MLDWPKLPSPRTLRHIIKQLTRLRFEVGAALSVPVLAGDGRNTQIRQWRNISLALAHAVTATSESLCVNPNATCRYKPLMVTACGANIDSLGS
jgi:hypothetical protein